MEIKGHIYASATFLPFTLYRILHCPTEELKEKPRKIYGSSEGICSVVTFKFAFLRDAARITKCLPIALTGEFRDLYLICPCKFQASTFVEATAGSLLVPHLPHSIHNSFLKSFSSI
jgi:hypothetical protein